MAGSAYLVVSKQGASSTHKVFAGRLGAYKWVCGQIVSLIAGHWNLSDPAKKADATVINSFISANTEANFSSAISHFNNCVSNTNSPARTIFSVNNHSYYADTEVATPALLFPVAGGSVTASATKAPAASAYKASKPGTTCRKCSVPNPYAYADNPDGTYLCRGCQIFVHIFTP